MIDLSVGGFSIFSGATWRVYARMYEYTFEVQRVLDGDTLEVSIDLGFSVWHRLIVRLARIDAFELSVPQGWIARAFLAQALDSAAARRLKSSKRDKGSEVRRCSSAR